MSNIVVLMGSLRPSGNTATIVNAFVRGASLSPQNQVTVLSVGDYKITPCTGCNACFKQSDGQCVLHDDMTRIFPVLAAADVLIIASPVYFYGISARLKAIIDRLHQPARSNFKVQKLGLLLVAAASLPQVFDSIKLQYQLILNFFHLSDVGRVFAYGVKEVGDVDHSQSVLNQAFLFGKSIL